MIEFKPPIHDLEGWFNNLLHSNLDLQFGCRREKGLGNLVLKLWQRQTSRSVYQRGQNWGLHKTFCKTKPTFKETAAFIANHCGRWEHRTAGTLTALGWFGVQVYTMGQWLTILQHIHCRKSLKTYSGNSPSCRDNSMQIAATCVVASLVAC